jgi:hypothetical protein
MEKDNTNNNISSSRRFVKGWSWGEINLKQAAVEFSSNSQQWFDIPYNLVSNVLLPTKNEIGLEFTPEDTGDVKYIII